MTDSAEVHVALAACFAVIGFLSGVIFIMSASLERLKSAVAAVTAKVEELRTQQGTPDAELDVLSAQLEAAVNPPAPPPAPVAPVVTTA